MPNMNKKESLREIIEREVDNCFEWPGADKAAVTTTSAKLFAEHVAAIAVMEAQEDHAQQVEDLENKLAIAKHQLEVLPHLLESPGAEPVAYFHHADKYWLDNGGKISVCIEKTEHFDTPLIPPAQAAAVPDRIKAKDAGRFISEPSLLEAERFAQGFNCCIDALNATPAPAEKVINADDLAQFIRSIDGNHSMGAGALAEAISAYIATAAPVNGECE